MKGSRACQYSVTASGLVWVVWFRLGRCGSDSDKSLVTFGVLRVLGLSFKG